METANNTNPNIIFSEKLLVDGKGPYSVTLFRDGTIDARVPETYKLVTIVPSTDICAAQQLSATELVIHYLCEPETPECKHRTHKKLTLNSTSQTSQQVDLAELSNTINDLTIRTRWKDKNPLLIFINPFSGAKRAVPMWKEKCEPLFDSVNIKYKLVETTGPGHALRSIRDDPSLLTEYSAIITVGGDGILCEAVNGILTRSDWRTAVLRMPIAPIAAGTGNATSYTLYGTLEPETAVCHILRGVTRPLDAFLCVQPVTKNFIWGVMGIAYGILAETDMGSEPYRFLGPLRWTILGALLLLTGSCPMKCKLSYLPALINNDEHVDSNEHINNDNEHINNEHINNEHINNEHINNENSNVTNDVNNGNKNSKKEFTGCEFGCKICARGKDHRVVEDIDESGYEGIKSEYLHYEDLTYGPEMTNSLNTYEEENVLIPQQYHQGLFSLKYPYK